MVPRIKVAIVGGGPSAFFAASRLLQLSPASQARRPEIGIHIYDRLWAPHGLVRYGVAPDHPEVKNCTHKFDDAAKDGRLKFFGNVNVSSTPSAVPHAMNVPLEQLFPHYTHLLLSSGCTVPRMHPALSASESCRPALELVHWYTQHPASRFIPPLEKIKHVSVIGHGNVALDVARMLLSPVERLEKYDVPSSVLSVLRKSSIKHVAIIGRRGPLEASFTTKELREMMNLEGTALSPIPDSVLSESNDGAQLTRQQTRLLQLLQKGSANVFGSTEKTWSIDFFRSPTGLASTPADSSHPTRLSLAHTMLDKERKAVPTGETSFIDTDLVLTSLGYRAEPTGDWYEPALGIVRNTSGRVVDQEGRVLRNVYASGWAATGAKGVLASTMLNAHSVVDTIISDLQVQSGDGVTGSEEGLQTGPVPPPATNILDGETIDLLNPNSDMLSVPEEILAAKRRGNVMNYEDWKRVDEEEVRRGEKAGKERERMSWDEARTFIDTVNI
ncbi:ARH1 [Sanghuangporus sanghuang]